jgi:hypothetical protein
MASKNGKRMAAVATLVASVVLMGGAAFASPASDGANPTGLAPEPISKALQTGRTTVAEVDRQIGQLH